MPEISRIPFFSPFRSTKFGACQSLENRPHRSPPAVPRTKKCIGIIQQIQTHGGTKFSELYQAYENFSESEGFEKLFPKRVLRGMLEKEGFEVGNSSRHNNQLFVSGVKVTWEEME
jgi:hypothetical protein